MKSINKIFASEKNKYHLIHASWVLFKASCKCKSWRDVPGTFKDGKYGTGSSFIHTFSQAFEATNLSCWSCHFGQTADLCTMQIIPPGFIIFNHSSNAAGSK